MADQPNDRDGSSPESATPGQHRAPTPESWWPESAEPAAPPTSGHDDLWPSSWDNEPPVDDSSLEEPPLHDAPLDDHSDDDWAEDYSLDPEAPLDPEFTMPREPAPTTEPTAPSDEWWTDPTLSPDDILFGEAPPLEPAAESEDPAQFALFGEQPTPSYDVSDPLAEQPTRVVPPLHGSAAGDPDATITYDWRADPAFFDDEPLAAARPEAPAAPPIVPPAEQFDETSNEPVADPSTDDGQDAAADLEPESPAETTDPGGQVIVGAFPAWQTAAPIAGAAEGVAALLHEDSASTSPAEAVGFDMIDVSAAAPPPMPEPDLDPDGEATPAEPESEDAATDPAPTGASFDLGDLANAAAVPVSDFGDQRFDPAAPVTEITPFGATDDEVAAPTPTPPPSPFDFDDARPIMGDIDEPWAPMAPSEEQPVESASSPDHSADAELTQQFDLGPLAATGAGAFGLGARVAAARGVDTTDSDKSEDVDPTSPEGGAGSVDEAGAATAVLAPVKQDASVEPEDDGLPKPIPGVDPQEWHDEVGLRWLSYDGGYIWFADDGQIWNAETGEVLREATPATAAPAVAGAVAAPLVDAEAGPQSHTGTDTGTDTSTDTSIEPTGAIPRAVDPGDPQATSVMPGVKDEQGASGSARSESTDRRSSSAAPADVPDYVEYSTRSRGRTLLVVVFALLALATIAAVFWAVSQGGQAPIGIAIGSAVATLAAWWALINWVPQVVVIDHSMLSVSKGRETERIDLADPALDIRVDEPDARDWHATITRPDGSHLKIDASSVHPDEFVAIVRKYRG